MPTFDFQCRKCNHVFEHSRPFGSIELPACPACGSKRSEKLIAPPAVHFKGSGWYKTDSRGGAPVVSAVEPRNAPVDATSSPKKDEKKSDDAKTETKPAESKPTEKKTEKNDVKKAPDKKS